MKTNFYICSIIILALACHFNGIAVVHEDTNFQDIEKPIYAEGELLVRFTPKSEVVQRSITERNNILLSLGGGTLKRNYKIVWVCSFIKNFRKI